MLELLLVAVSVGLSNLAAAIAIGVTGVDASTRLRVGLVFGAFESGMPVVGLAIGSGLAGAVGHASRWLAGALLIAAGGYGLITSLRGRPGGIAPADGKSLLLGGLVLSLDNLVVGFALGTAHTPVLVGALVIGLVSVGLSLAGLELGARIGHYAGERGEQLAGLMLISVGIAIAAGALS
jgi:manganese efflux pump family protein